jgi:hypothetical protein
MRKEEEKGLPRIQNCFSYFLFLIATKRKEVFTAQKMKEGKKKEMKKNDFSFDHA